MLQCGTLTGQLGAARNVPGVQEKAKDLLTEAVREFQSLGNYRKASEAQAELGACYWRLGAHDDARVLMREALKPLTESDDELKAKIHIRRTLVEISEDRYHDALNILTEAEPVFESANDAVKGRWHGQRAIIFLKLAATEHRTDYADRAIIEFTAAIYHYERARHERYCASNINNLAFLLYKLGRYEEAHEQLDRAGFIFTKLKDAGTLAQVDETRARVLAAEQKYREADRTLAGAIRRLLPGPCVRLSLTSVKRWAPRLQVRRAGARKYARRSVTAPRRAHYPPPNFLQEGSPNSRRSRLNSTHRVIAEHHQRGERMKAGRPHRARRWNPTFRAKPFAGKARTDYFIAASSSHQTGRIQQSHSNSLDSGHVSTYAARLYSALGAKLAR